MPSPLDPVRARQNDPLIDAAVLARQFNVTTATVRNWIAAGRVRAIQTPSGRWKITPDEYDRLKAIKASKAQTPQIEST